MNKKTGLNTAQRDELRALLLARQRELAAQMEQNEANLAPPTSDDASPNSREVDQALTDLDLDEIARVEPVIRALAPAIGRACSGRAGLFSTKLIAARGCASVSRWPSDSPVRCWSLARQPDPNRVFHPSAWRC